MLPCVCIANVLMSVAAPPPPSVAWMFPLRSDSYGGATIADLDGDGRLEVAFGTYFGDGSVHVLRGADGTEEWHFKPEADACLDASSKAADVDGDGHMDLVVPISNLSRVVCLDGATGTVKWTCQLDRAECIDTPPWVGDADGDGAIEIVVGTFAGRLHVIAGKDGALKRSLAVAPGAVQSGPVLCDLNGDGTLDFLAGNFRGDHALHAVNGGDGTPLWKVQTSGHLYHGPAVGDLTGDARPEFVFGSYDGTVYAVSTSGQVLWTTKPGDRYFMSPVVIADVDGDGRAEAVIASQRVTALRGDGTVLWSTAADDSNGRESVTRGVSVADLDGDGGLDLVCMNGAGLLRVFRGRDGALLREIDLAKLVGHPVEHSSHVPTIADLTGDGKLDVFVVVGVHRQANGDQPALSRGTAICLTGFAGRGPGWTMHRGDLGNTGTPALPARE